MLLLAHALGLLGLRAWCLKPDQGCCTDIVLEMLMPQYITYSCNAYPVEGGVGCCWRAPWSCLAWGVCRSCAWFSLPPAAGPGLLPDLGSCFGAAGGLAALLGVPVCSMRSCRCWPGLHVQLSCVSHDPRGRASVHADASRIESSQLAARLGLFGTAGDFAALSSVPPLRHAAMWVKPRTASLALSQDRLRACQLHLMPGRHQYQMVSAPA